MVLSLSFAMTFKTIKRRTIERLAKNLNNLFNIPNLFNSIQERKMENYSMNYSHEHLSSLLPDYCFNWCALCPSLTFIEAR